MKVNCLPTTADNKARQFVYFFMFYGYFALIVMTGACFAAPYSQIDTNVQKKGTASLAQKLLQKAMFLQHYANGFNDGVNTFVNGEKNNYNYNEQYSKVRKRKAYLKLGTKQEKESAIGK